MQHLCLKIQKPYLMPESQSTTVLLYHALQTQYISLIQIANTLSCRRSFGYSESRASEIRRILVVTQWSDNYYVGPAERSISNLLDPWN